MNGKVNEAGKMRTLALAAMGLSMLLASTATAVPNTLFLAHYDGIDEPSPQQLDADYAVGNPVVQGSNGVISSMAQFGSGSLDPSPGSAGAVSYETVNNFNLDAGTVEMFVQTDNWADGAFRGLFAVWSGSSATGDIRMQKTNGNQLQAYFTPNTGGVWSVTSGALDLDAGWHHIAWTWDVNTNMAALYVDGVVVDDTPSVALTPYNGVVNATFQVGSLQSAGSSVQWPGLIDELRISDIDRYQGQAFSVPTEPFVPEPATLSLMAIGSLAVLGRRRGVNGNKK